MVNNIKQNSVDTMNQLIGKSKVTTVLPLLERVAEENSLKLNRANDFKKARVLLSERYIVTVK